MVNSPPAQRTDRRIWTEAEEAYLMAYIFTNQSGSGNGLNFPKAFWNKAASELEKKYKVHPVKEGEHCSGKWQRVHTIPIS